MGNTPNAAERHSDIDFAISDAFHRARRQLQDQAGLLQGKIKAHKYILGIYRSEYLGIERYMHGASVG